MSLVARLCNLRMSLDFQSGMLEQNEETFDGVHSAEESVTFFKVLCAFKAYRRFTKEYIGKRQAYIKTLPQCQQKALEKYSERLSRLQTCVDHNSKLISLIVRDKKDLFENIRHDNVPYLKRLWRSLTTGDIEKVQLTLKQFYRDWSEEGAGEREMCYKPIIDAIDEYFPEDSCQRDQTSVLVPGAGLARLAFEIAKKGFICQGNEFSMFMLFASHFILNRCKGTHIYTVYPWVYNCENNMKSEDQTVGVTFPDINPDELCTHYDASRFSMIAGDFLEVYTKENEWDCVATCFFIDCAANIYLFIEKIYSILKPGGIWISLGPLQYHYSMAPDTDSIEPSYEVVREIIKSVGFIIEKEETGRKATYSQNPASMFKMVYECVFSVCRKPFLVPSEKDEDEEHDEVPS